jgi:diguanylate cyclase (GGDEF)-like protein
MIPVPPLIAATASGGERHVVDPQTVLSSIGEAVYDWDIASDHLSWSGNPLQLMNVADLELIRSGASFNMMLDPLSPATRNEVILLAEGSDSGGGVPYRLIFALRSKDGSIIWFEDTGRWFAGADGRPATAHGAVRRTAAPSDVERGAAAPGKLDELTGAYQRSLFLKLMAEDIQKASKKNAKSLFLLMAIDDLDFVNQTYGYEVADQVIAGVSRRIKGAIRKKDRMVRYSGTKLGVLLSPFTAEDPREAVQRLQSAVEEAPIKTAAGAVVVGLMAGGVSIPTDGADPIDLMRKSEESLAEAKEKRHRGAFAMYKTDTGREQTRRQNISVSEDILRVLNERRVVPAFEPVLMAKTGEVAFHEALVRVKSGDGTILGASAIIPPAERFGLIKFVDIRVMELSMARMTARPADRLSINVSMRTALTPEWLNALTAGLAGRQDLAERLIIEVTETAAMADIEATADILGKVKALGCQIAIDDFGSGHTSFRSLRVLPIDILKIDGVFVQNISRSTDDRFFVRTLLDLAKHLKVKTVAEWVQDAESAAMLAEWGVDYLQGEFCGHATLDDQPTKLARAG